MHRRPRQCGDLLVERRMNLSGGALVQIAQKDVRVQDVDAKRLAGCGSLRRIEELPRLLWRCPPILDQVASDLIENPL
jgi:hypothetical protein